ncbi:MAG: hypothetical protein WAN87_04635 [Thermoplasmata archaeon]
MSSRLFDSSCEHRSRAEHGGTFYTLNRETIQVTVEFRSLEILHYDDFEVFPWEGLLDCGIHGFPEVLPS